LRVGVLLAVTFVMVVKPDALIGGLALALGILAGLSAGLASRGPKIASTRA
jgi:hypothetical protein